MSDYASVDEASSALTEALSSAGADSAPAPVETPIEPAAAPVADQAPATPPTDAALRDAGLTPGEIKRLKDENLRYRQERNEAVAPWEGWDADSKAFMQQAIQMATKSPGEAASMLSQVVAALTAPQQQSPAEEPLTRSQLIEFFQQQQQEQQMAQAVSSVREQARSLGIDPENRAQYEAFLAYARDYHDADLAAAKQALDGYQAQIRQQAIDEYVAEKAGAAKAKPTVAGGSPGAPAQQSAEPQTLDEASEMLRRTLSRS